jgi:hypothetical protein
MCKRKERAAKQMGDICTNLDALLKDIRRNLTINNYSSFVCRYWQNMKTDDCFVEGSLDTLFILVCKSLGQKNIRNNSTNNFAGQFWLFTFRPNPTKSFRNAKSKFCFHTSCLGVLTP